MANNQNYQNPSNENQSNLEDMNPYYDYTIIVKSFMGESIPCSVNIAQIRMQYSHIRLTDEKIKPLPDQLILIHKAISNRRTALNVTDDTAIFDNVILAQAIRDSDNIPWNGYVTSANEKGTELYLVGQSGFSKKIISINPEIPVVNV